MTLPQNTIGTIKFHIQEINKIFQAFLRSKTYGMLFYEFRPEGKVPTTKAAITTAKKVCRFVTCGGQNPK